MRLVLCDDNRILCEALASVFQARGHRILAIATRVTDGIAAVATHRPDACLLDLRFPDGSGLDAAQAIRRCSPDTKILVLSCVDDPAVLSEARKIGVAGFLRKDLKADTIMDALEVIDAGGMAFGPEYTSQASWRAAGAASREPPGHAHAARDAGPAADRRGPEHRADGPRDGRRNQHPAQLHKEHSGQARSAQPAPGRRHREPRTRRFDATYRIAPVMGLTGSLPVAAPMGIRRAVGPQAGKIR